MPNLHFPRYVDPEDRPLLFRLLVRGLCGAPRQPATGSQMIKAFGWDGEMHIVLVQARPLAPLLEPQLGNEEDGRLSGLFLRFEPVRSRYVSGRPLSHMLIQQFRPPVITRAAEETAAQAGATTAQGTTAPPAEGGAAAAAADGEEGPRRVEGLSSAPAMACLPAAALEANEESFLFEMAPMLFPARDRPVIVPDPGLVPEEDKVQATAAQQQQQQQQQQEQEQRHPWEDGEALISAFAMATPPGAWISGPPLPLPLVERYPTPQPDFVAGPPVFTDHEIGAIFEADSDAGFVGRQQQQQQQPSPPQR